MADESQTASPRGAAPQAENSPLVRRIRTWNPDALAATRLDRGELTLTVGAERLAALAQYLRDDAEARFDLLADVTCVDRWPSTPRFEVVYHLYGTTHHQWLRLKVPAAEDQAVPSLSGLWPSANWFEREVFDLFGVRFEGHPFLRRIMMPDNWEGHPLRKDYPVEGYR